MAPNAHDRRYVRRPVRVSVRVRDAGDPAEGDLLFDALDLSQGGAFLASDLLLETGDEVEIDFTIPGEREEIRARARVAWTTRGPGPQGKAGMGLQFTGLTSSARQLIADFVRSIRQT